MCTASLTDAQTKVNVAVNSLLAMKTKAGLQLRTLVDGAGSEYKGIVLKKIDGNFNVSCPVSISLTQLLC